MNREALFEQFLVCLQQQESPPDFLGAEPDDLSPFDPYRMVGEWIALRHEVKQQGKHLQSSQMMLQKALETARRDREQLQTLSAESQQTMADRYEKDLAAQQTQAEKEQERLLQDLLAVLDALDRACEHWQTIQDEASSQGMPATASPAADSAAAAAQVLQPEPLSWPANWLRPVWIWLGLFPAQSQPLHDQTAATQTAATQMAVADRQRETAAEILQSGQEGLTLIRRILLEVLQQRKVVPIEAQAQPFDASFMYAVGRQESEDVPENTVLQEVVRGYRWRDRILREAQVIVAVKPKP